MDEHSVFAFSATERWAKCPGSMSYPENTADGIDGGIYADEGTAAHKLAALLLKSKSGMVAEDWIGKVIKGGNREFEITEEFAGHVQTYVDDVKRRSIGGYLMVEQRVTLEGVEGFDASNYGTADAIMIGPFGAAVVEDLKFGQGEKVNAWEYAKTGAPFTLDLYEDDDNDAPTLVEPNYQLMMYALAALGDLALLADDVKSVTLVINQPRLGHISELTVPIAVLNRFALFAADALKHAELAMGLGVRQAEKQAGMFNPGEKQCRWCRAVTCQARLKKVQQEVAADFGTIAAEPPTLPTDTVSIAKALAAIPFITDWCRAVQARANEMVAADVKIMGPDNQPYKFIEGKQGDRKWSDAKAAEAALVGVLGPKAYKPQEILSAAGAAKILDKKTTKQTWADVFVPLIKRAPGKPQLALGSDPRPAYSPASSADEFEIEADWSIP
jgi:hypothetical protein